MSYFLYFLVFLFGYITSRTFYFIGSASKSVKILESSQIVSLVMLTLALEKLHYAQEFQKKTMKKNGDSDHNLSAFGFRFENELSFFKKRGVSAIIDAHGDFFNQAVSFDDWSSAMEFLEDNREQVNHFLSKEGA